MRGMFEPIKDATTPDEMRAEISRFSYYDPMVRHAMRQADYLGMNGEDRYTLLAFLALKSRQQLRETIFMTEVVKK
jgi:hypothetical protein